jgi:hypothetical protein
MTQNVDENRFLSPEVILHFRLPSDVGPCRAMSILSQSSRTEYSSLIGPAFTLGIDSDFNRSFTLPQEVIQAPSVNAFKNRLDKYYQYQDMGN